MHSDSVSALTMLISCSNHSSRGLVGEKSCLLQRNESVHLVTEGTGVYAVPTNTSDRSANSFHKRHRGSQGQMTDNKPTLVARSRNTTIPLAVLLPLPHSRQTYPLTTHLHRPSYQREHSDDVQHLSGLVTGTLEGVATTLLCEE
jgi:hypothetical protein